MQKIRVLVVDDHTLVRDGICALLGLASDVEVAGEASNGIEALEMVRKILPDVVIMDLAMPIMSGQEAIRRIHKEFPNIRILALSQYDNKEYVFPVLNAGAYGYISKASASSDLVTGIRSVYQGDSFLSPSVAKHLVENYRQGGIPQDNNDPYESLTDREREVLKLLADGYTITEIAKILTISPKTTDGHKTSLMAKLDIHNRADLIKYALRKGIITI
jgi:two-component system response regulator NreC